MLKLSILAVDDSPVITEMIRDAFEVRGYKVLTAEDGVQALKISLEEHPDLIIADVSMPGMDGWELCSQIRSNPFTSFIPFIFLSSKAEAPDRIKGLTMGADDYLTKPFDMEELMARVKLIFDRMRKTQEAVLVKQQKTLSGSTKEMGLPDLLQMFSLNQKTGLLKITKVGLPDGKISLENGKIIRARLGTHRGEKALYRLMRWEDAHFVVDPLMEREPDPDIPGDVQNSLMEGMRQIDEIKELENQYPLSGKKLQVPVRPGESELSPREAELLGAINNSSEFSEVMDTLPWTDFDIYKMAVYFIRKQIIAIT